MTELPRLGVGGRGGGVCEPVRLWQRCAAALAMISSCLSWKQSSRLGGGGAAPERVPGAAHWLGDGGDPLGFLEFRNRLEIFRRYLRAPVALVSRGPRRHASWTGARERHGSRGAAAAARALND